MMALQIDKPSMKKILLLFAVSVVIMATICQKNAIEIIDLSREKVPKVIQFQGKMLLAKKWKDKTGENILIISRDGPKKQSFPDRPSYESASVSLYIQQFIKKKNNYDLLWIVKDSIMDCQTDMWMGVVDSSISITDLNSNNVTETTFAYSYFCRGGVAPANLKVILHEDNKSFELVGKMYLKLTSDKPDPDNYEFNYQIFNKQINDLPDWVAHIGRYSNETDFEDAPKVFLIFAREKWKECFNKDNSNFRSSDYM